MCHNADAELLSDVVGSLRDGTWSSRLHGWLQSQLAVAPQPSPMLRSHLTLLQSCNIAMRLMKDTGFELALQLLASKCVATKQSLPDASMSAASSIPTNDGGPFAPATAGMSEAAAARLSWALMQDLSDKVCHLQLALQALRAGLTGADFSFPRFQELVKVLAEMQEKKSTWHSIVFVKERQSVHAILAMLQKVSQLSGVQFYSFTGRAANSKQRLACTPLTHTSGLRSDGMKLREQKTALTQFKEAQGMAVLVATAAAEEGIDIINCELVVCYTVVETGRERAQRRGRARQAGSLCVNIIEEHDQAKLDSARLAECNARLAQVHMSDKSL